jgi:signal peptidase I
MENNINQISNENILPRSKMRKFFDDAWDLIKFAIIALVIVIPIRMFIAQPFVVSGESMYPTFHDGEYLIVDELSYNLGEPKRGDVIVFRYPGDTKRFFIKRVIGMPNEEIIIDKGKIKIINQENKNGFTLNEPYVKEYFDTSTTFKTKDNEYFVMGDNRNKSSDSRVWGMLPNKLIVGRAYIRLLPFKEISYLPGSHEKNNYGK